MQVRAFHLQIVGISFGWPKHTVRWRTQSFGSAFAGQGPTGRGRASRCHPEDPAALSNLDYALSTQESLLDARPQSVEGFEQGAGAAIAQAYPQQTRGAFGAAGEVEEVLIFGYYYASSLAGVLPYFRVGGCVQMNGFHVLALMPEGSQVPRQGGGQLVVNKKLHDAWRTAWSVWCAAYSIAARMSSLSSAG